MTAFEDKVLEWIQTRRLFDGTGRVLLAVSGGADSVAMLRALAALRQAGRLDTDLAVGHVNHCLRAEASDGDERFVNDLARELSLPIYAAQADVPAYAKEHRLSIETAARLLRRRALIDMARQAACTAIATAHHLDDQAETLIHRLQRGTGFRGLAGIRPTAELDEMRFARPLLTVRRSEILEYLRQGNFPWREDHTNADTQMTRNRIRHRTLPFLQAQASADLPDHLARLARHADGLIDRIDRRASAFKLEIEPYQIRFEQPAAAQLSPLVLGELLRRCLVALDIGLRDYTRRHYRHMQTLIRTARRTTLHLPGGAELTIRRGKVTLRRR